MSNKKMTYKEMISMLQAHTYNAPNQWNAIEADLDLGGQISQLKTHSAPEDLWSKIDAELDATPEAPQSIPRTMGINPSVYLLLGAAAIIGYFLWNTSKKNKLDVSYSSEVMESIASINTPVEGPVNTTLLEAVNFIDQNDFLYTAKDKLDYKKQMAQLEEAEQEIKNMQEQYGADKNSRKMLAKIEREKAELIKSMIKGA